MDLKRRRVSVPSADRLSSAIHYSLNASRCHLYYGKVVPDWQPQWGEKNGCKILLEVLGENKGEAVMDGCIWPMQGRRQRCSHPDETGSLVSWCPLCPEQPSLVRGRGISSVSASITCVKTDALHIQRINLCFRFTWGEYRSPARLSRLYGRTDVRTDIGNTCPQM